MKRPELLLGGQDRITMRLHPGGQLELVFHRGAKVRDNADFAFIDRTGKIEWAAPDRGIFSITDLLKQRGEIVELVADWILATRANPTG